MTYGDLHTRVSDFVASLGINATISLRQVIQAVSAALEEIAAETRLFKTNETISPDVASSNEYTIMGSSRSTSYDVVHIEEIYDSGGDKLDRLSGGATKMIDSTGVYAIKAWYTEDDKLYTVKFDPETGGRNDWTDQDITIHYSYVPDRPDPDIVTGATDLPGTGHHFTSLLHTAIRDAVFNDILVSLGQFQIAAGYESRVERLKGKLRSMKTIDM